MTERPVRPAAEPGRGSCAAGDRDHPPRGRHHGRPHARPAAPPVSPGMRYGRPRSSRRSRGAGPLTVPVFGFRHALERCSRSAGVAWYRHWHEVFLRNALRRRLAEVGDCVVYAQGPLAARAALYARRGPHQRVIMAVHFRISQADEWADKKQITPGGRVFRAIRQDRARGNPAGRRPRLRVQVGPERAA